jgi:hypothetical protein
MKEPRSAQRIENREQDINNVLAAQSKLLQLIVGIGVVIVIAVAAVGYALYHEIGLVDRRVSALQRSTQAGIERTNVLTAGNSTGIVTLLKEQGNLDQKVGRIESTVAPNAAAPATAIAGLNPTETAGLRALFNLARNANASPRFKVGDKIPADDVKPVPENVYQAIPRLKGTRFLIDQDGALVVTAGADNSVILIVNPA